MTSLTLEPNAQLQAVLELEDIVKLVKDVGMGYNKQAVTSLLAKPAGIEVRSGWHPPLEPARFDEYCVLLRTGDEAVRITGTLDEGCPVSADIEYRGTYSDPWQVLRGISLEDAGYLLEFARYFWYGENKNR